jgi:hypothetical protein
VRLLVCGHREFDDWDRLCQEIEAIYVDCEDRTKDGKVDFTIIEGEAKGADFLARVWAKYRYLPFEAYPADWKQFGNRAGPIRNAEMLSKGRPDMVLAFLAEGSKGTADMIRQAEKAGVPVKVVNIN